MKFREQLLMGAVVVTTGCAGWLALTASRLGTELAVLQAEHQQLQENHRRLRKVQLELAAQAGMTDRDFRKLLAVLETEEGVDVTSPSGPTTTRINEVSRIHHQ